MGRGVWGVERGACTRVTCRGGLAPSSAGWVPVGRAGGWQGTPRGPFSVRTTVVCPPDARRRHRFLGAVRVGSWLGHPWACTTSRRRGWRRGPGLRRSGPLVTKHTAPGSRQLPGGDWAAHPGRSWTERPAAALSCWRIWGDVAAGRCSRRPSTCCWWLRGPPAPCPSLAGCLPYRHLRKRSRGGPASVLAGNWTLSGAGGCLGLELRSWPPPLGCCSL